MRVCNKRSGARAAFSLIETVLAIGIMGLAVVALLGLLPHGLEMTRKAGDENAYARILGTMRTELMRMPFDKLSGADKVRWRFDDQGVVIASSAGIGTLQSYIAEVDLNGPLNKAVILTGGITSEPKLWNFVIHIASSPLADYDFTRTPAKAYRSYPVLVARNFITNS